MVFYKDCSGAFLFFLTHVMIICQIIIVYLSEDHAFDSHLIFHKFFFYIFTSLAFYSHIMASFVSPGSLTHNNNPDFLEFYLLTHGPALKRGAALNQTLKPDTFNLIEEDDSIVSEFDEMEFEPVTSVTEATMERIISELKVPLNRCGQCYMVRTLNVHHCSTCHCCVFKRDHHCPWINNCVGQFNQKFFLLFLLYAFIGCSESLVVSLYYILYKHWTLFKNGDIAWLIAVFVEVLFALVFVIFILCMFKEEYDIFAEELLVIDEKRKRITEKRMLMELLEETFGGKLGVNWFLPFWIGGYSHIYQRITMQKKSKND